MAWQCIEYMMVIKIRNFHGLISCTLPQVGVKVLHKA